MSSTAIQSTCGFNCYILVSTFMMDDLASLRQAFAAAQQNVVTTVKLSERSCVDILFKLIEQKRISLIKTMNGTEFLTWTQLEGEIMLALSQAGGRINLANLSCELGVSLDFVEMKVEELLKQQKHQLSVVQGDLIRSSYLQNISEEINENLQECGQLFFAELSERYSLPAEYLREKLAARMQTCIHGSLHQQQLTTKIFDNRILACARGSLLAACIPVALEHVATAFRLDMDAVLQASQKLINDSVVAGRIHNFFFFPTSYSEAQQKKIEDFFNDNLFVPYKAVKETFATNPKEYLIQKFPGGLVLQKYFVGEKLAESFLAHMREALRSDSWTDLSYLFPLSFDKTDMNELMQRLIEEYIRCRDSAQLIDIVLFVSNNFIDSMIEELKPIIEEKAANDADNGLDSIFSTAGYSKAITLDQSHTDEIPQNKKTGTKRGKPKKNKRKESPDIAVNVVETQSLMNEINGILSNDTVSAIIGEKWLEFPEASREMLRELLMRDSLKIYQKAFSDARQPNAIKQKSEFSQKAVQLETRFERMQLEMRSLQAFGISSANTELPSYPLSVYLLNKLSVEILDPLLAFLFHDIKGIHQHVSRAVIVSCSDLCGDRNANYN
ncbi:hypothetical protein IE077_002064 [Cardiosporidium cionae]|uniref:E3 UFM1-protein ligase 1-like N-terminal domain-containing protein n=1 Tax=Cardiosporidium cionae TaxID=476202 RepID=A0ABQ7JG16_9APIC|nr:hypothetical protein IE077_002064 [Cardiosporidium cionae]|eukprot:KAF8822924.1 hypothetical protein IE077_002064 [Cardiosporidium cionae]